MTEDTSMTVANLAATAAAPEAVAPLQDPATQAGLEDLALKLAPLLQGRRLHNIVDLLSAISDTIDMADDALIQKMMRGLEEGVAGAWALGNAARMAGNLAARETAAPSLLDLYRRSRDPDVRAGMAFTLNFLQILGKQVKAAHQPIDVD